MVLQSDPVILRKHVTALASIEPPRSVAHPESLKKAVDYIVNQFKDVACRPAVQDFKVGRETYQNVSVLLGPAKGKRIVIGAHYDVAGDQPGADDNASGVAGVLELARLLKPLEEKLSQPVELVAYALEEPPHFGGPTMGSYAHAEKLKKEKVEVEFMASLEMIGFFKDEKESQTYPVPQLKLLYPSVGNYIAIAGRLEEGSLITNMKKLFQKATDLPIETLSAPRGILGVDLSDHISYWEHGMKAVIVTDTAFMRNDHYHRKSDRPETLDYERMAKVVDGIRSISLYYSDPL